MLHTAQQLTYQRIALQVLQLQHLGLNYSAIVRLLGVTAKTVAKGIRWLELHLPVAAGGLSFWRWVGVFGRRVGQFGDELAIGHPRWIRQDALRLARTKPLRSEFKELQGYWSRQARERGILTEDELERYLRE